MTHEDLDVDLKRFNLRISVIAGVVSIIGAALICMGFVWNINSNQKKNTESIQKIEKNLDEMNSRLDATDVFKGASEVEMKNFKEQLDRVENNQQKILDLLLEK